MGLRDVDHGTYDVREPYKGMKGMTGQTGEVHYVKPNERHPNVLLLLCSGRSVFNTTPVDSSTDVTCKECLKQSGEA